MNDDEVQQRVCRRCYQVVPYSNNKSAYPLQHDCPHGMECTRVPHDEAPPTDEKQKASGCVRCLIEIREALDDSKPFKRSRDKY